MRPILQIFLEKQRKHAIDDFSRHIIPLLVSVDEFMLLLGWHELSNGSLPLISYGNGERTGEARSARASQTFTPPQVSDVLWRPFDHRFRKLNYRALKPSNGFCPVQVQPTSESHPPCFLLPCPSRIVGDSNRQYSVFVTFLQCFEHLNRYALSEYQHNSLHSLQVSSLLRLENLDIRLDADKISPEAGVAFTSFLSTHREYLGNPTLSMYPDLFLSVQIYQDIYNTSLPFLHTLVLDRT